MGDYSIVMTTLVVAIVTLVAVRRAAGSGRSDRRTDD